jgi:hypothetical protein
MKVRFLKIKSVSPLSLVNGFDLFDYYRIHRDIENLWLLLLNRFFPER